MDFLLFKKKKNLCVFQTIYFLMYKLLFSCYRYIPTTTTITTYILNAYMLRVL